MLKVIDVHRIPAYFPHIHRAISSAHCTRMAAGQPFWQNDSAAQTAVSQIVIALHRTQSAIHPADELLDPLTGALKRECDQKFGCFDLGGRLDRVIERQSNGRHDRVIEIIK